LCSRATRIALLIALSLALPAGGARAKVFYSRSEALALAFPDADHIEDRTHVLSEEHVARIESLAHAPLDSKLVRIYTGFEQGEVVGYAFIDVHTVRTLPEAFLIVLSPQGAIRTLRVLAFHEPLEYKPSDRWYSQFEDKSLAEPLRLGGDVHGIVGATLSARATTRGVRRALALYEVVVQNAH
jgi:Na+-translocating ferredoxin:NAD+ oxidoreductase RnfG subunit